MEPNMTANNRTNGPPDTACIIHNGRGGGESWSVSMLLDGAVTFWDYTSSAINGWISEWMYSMVEWYWQKKLKSSEKNASQCYSLHYRSHTDWPRGEAGLQWRIVWATVQHWMNWSHSKTPFVRDMLLPLISKPSLWLSLQRGLQVQIKHLKC